jgi:hypothetical protein
MPVDPKYQYEAPQAAASIAKTQTDIADTRTDNARQDAEFRAKLYADGLEVGPNGRIVPIPGWKDPKKAASLNDPKRVLEDLAKTDNILSTIQAARTLINEGGSTGWGSYKSYFPDNDARDLSNYLDTVRSNLTFDRLQEMRDNSPTGGAVGNASDNDMRLLGSTVASLDQGASRQKLLDSLDRIEQHYTRFQAFRAGVNPDTDEGKTLLRGAFGGSMGGDSGQGGGGGPDGYRIGTNPQFSTPQDKRFAALAQSAFDRGASYEEMQGLAQQYGYAQGFNGPGLRQALEYRQKGGKGVIVNAPQSGYDDPGILERAKRDVAASPVGTYFGQAANALTAGTLDELGGVAQGDSIADAFAGRGENTNRLNLQKSLSAISNPASALAGNLSGGIIGLMGAGAATGGLKAASMFAPRALAADAAYGAAYGAGESNQDRLGGAAMGGALGAAGGALGRGAVGAIGTAVGGVSGPAALLRDRGVRLTPGQIGESMGGPVGRYLKRREDRLAGFSGIGDVIGQRQAEGIDQFNSAAFREGFGRATEVPPTIGEAGIDYARDVVVPNTYGRALDGQNFTPDQQFAQGIGGLRSQAQGLPAMGGQAEYALKRSIDPFIDPATNNISGRNLQKITQELQRRAGRLDNSPDADGPDAAGIVRGALGEVGDMVERQAPGVMPAFRDANSTYMNFKILEDAVAAGLNAGGKFTPAQLGTVSRSAAKKYGGKHASESRPFFELQRAGQDVLPSKIPDSGTAGRQAAGDGLIGAVKAALRNARIPLYSEPALEAINMAAISRPASARAAGEQIRNRAMIGGLFGAPYLVTSPSY